jgi:fucose 4-O-acetylase-like acetyltransferase
MVGWVSAVCARGIDEGAQIRLCRVLCIFFMMSVHVNPGLGKPSVVATGDFWWIGFLWGDVLGRASVAALSFVSGYLLVRTAADAPLGRLAVKRFRTLLVPMLTWTLIFCLLQLAKAMLLHRPEASVLLQPGADLVGALTGLTGPTANLSLFFLRDLFVAGLLVRLLLPALAARALLVLAVLAIATVFSLTEPVVFRPQVLFFVAAGAAWALRVPALNAGLTPRRVAATAAVLAALLSVTHILALRFHAWHAPVHELADLLRRCLLVVLTLAVSARLVATRAAARLVPLERRIFETYLLHVPLIGMLWLPWLLIVGGPDQPSYAGFFLLAPAAALAAGQGFGAACDRLPAPLQLLLRGKAKAGRPVAALPPSESITRAGR